MSVTRIATRYAASLIDLAVEQGKLENVLSDVRSLIGAMESRDLLLLVKSPIIHAAKKVSVFEALFNGKFEATTMAFLKLVIRKGREAYLPEIAASFVDQYRQLKNIVAVKVTSAVALTDAKIEAIRQKIAATPGFQGSIEIETVVDPSIIGGLIIEMGDRQYDASVVHQLDKMKKSFQA